MPDFTEDEIREARESPRVGDVWDAGDADVTVAYYENEPAWVVLTVTIKETGSTSRTKYLLGDFRWEIRDATLVRRGA